MTELRKKFLKDKDGNRILPITHMEAVKDSQGNSLASVLGDFEDETEALISAEKTRAQAAESALQNNIEALTQSNIVVVADHTQVASPVANTIYREQGTTSYSDWMYYNNAWQKMAEYDNAVDDAPTAGSDNLVKSDGIYENFLSTISDDSSIDIPISLEKYYDPHGNLVNGGMDWNHSPLLVLTTVCFPITLKGQDLVASIVYFNKNKQFISSYVYTQGGTTPTEFTIDDFIDKPENAYFVAFSSYSSPNVDKIQTKAAKGFVELQKQIEATGGKFYMERIKIDTSKLYHYKNSFLISICAENGSKINAPLNYVPSGTTTFTGWKGNAPDAYNVAFDDLSVEDTYDQITLALDENCNGKYITIQHTNTFEPTEKYAYIENGALKSDGTLEHGGYNIYKTTDFIPFTVGDVFFYKTMRNTVNNVHVHYCVYDNNKNFLYPDYRFDNGDSVDVNFIAPTSGAYIRFTYNDNTANSMNMFVLKGKWNGKTDFKDPNSNNILREMSITDYRQSRWNEKTVVFFGDSITAMGYYVNEFYTMTNANAINKGWGGITIANRGDNYALVAKLGELPASMDAFVMLAGVNDFQLGVPLGNFENYNTDGSLNNTVFGALHTIFRYLLNNYPKMPIIIGTPMHTDIIYEGGEAVDWYVDENDILHEKKYGVGGTLKEVVDAIKKTAQFYSLPVVDLYSKSQICPILPVNKQITTEDGLHPNMYGATIISSWLVSELNNICYGKN